MDTVHGREHVVLAEKATVHPGRWAGAAESGGMPHGDVALGA